MTTFQVLMNRFHKGSVDSVSHLLPEEDRENLLSQTIESADIGFFFNEQHALIKPIHYSWIQDPLRSFPEPLHAPLLAVLTPAQQDPLKSLLNPSQEIPTLSPPVKNYFLSLLSEKIIPEKQIPFTLLPRSEMTPLTRLTKNQLVTLISFLSLYDLAEELKTIVDRRRLQVLYESMRDKKQQFLRICLHEKQKLSLPKIGIEKYVDKRDKLEKILHKRGLIRLATALSGQREEFAWYLSRLLDTGRGKIFLHHWSKNPSPGITTLLAQQVHSVIKFLKFEETSG